MVELCYGPLFGCVRGCDERGPLGFPAVAWRQRCRSTWTCVSRVLEMSRILACVRRADIPFAFLAGQPSLVGYSAFAFFGLRGWRRATREQRRDARTRVRPYSRRKENWHLFFLPFLGFWNHNGNGEISIWACRLLAKHAGNKQHRNKKHEI